MSPDLTIESALSDPLIRAVMRADRIEPQAFEGLMRMAAETISRRVRRDEPPFRAIVVPKPAGIFSLGLCCA